MLEEYDLPTSEKIILNSSSNSSINALTSFIINLLVNFFLNNSPSNQKLFKTNCDILSSKSSNSIPKVGNDSNSSSLNSI